MNACTKYLQLTTVGRGTENAQWPPKSPWLYYQTDSVEDTLHKKDIDATYNFKKGTPVNVEINNLSFSFSSMYRVKIFSVYRILDSISLLLVIHLMGIF